MVVIFLINCTNCTILVIILGVYHPIVSFILQKQLLITKYTNYVLPIKCFQVSSWQLVWHILYTNWFNKSAVGLCLILIAITYINPGII